MPQSFDIKMKSLFAVSALVAGSTFALPAAAQVDMQKRPALVITNKSMPGTEITPFYNRPTRTEEITPADITGNAYFQPTDTVVSRKITELKDDLFTLQTSVSRLSEQLEALEKRNQAQSAEYYAHTATISTQLQSGTTPGNPRLVNRLSQAQTALDGLSQNVAELNALAVLSLYVFLPAGISTLYVRSVRRSRRRSRPIGTIGRPGEQHGGND
jgi:uncharacterized coiled-coil protein SlyX